MKKMETSKIVLFDCFIDSYVIWCILFETPSITFISLHIIFSHGNFKDYIYRRFAYRSGTCKIRSNVYY